MSCSLLEFFEDIQCNEIENWDDICWVIFELFVKLLVEFVDVIAVNIERIILNFSNLFEFCDVIWLLHIPVIIAIATKIHLVIILLEHKCCQKFSESDRKIVCVDVGTPKNLSIAG